MDNSLSDYLRARQVAPQWRHVLPAFGRALSANIPAETLRVLLQDTGTAFAQAVPVAQTESVAGMQDAMNAVWDAQDWGWVRIEDHGDALVLSHHASPLAAAFGPHAMSWTPAFLEGAYQQWFRQLGAADTLRVRLHGDIDDAGIVTLRFGQ